MAMKVLSNFGNASINKWLLSGVQYNIPKNVPQTSLRHVRSFRRLRDQAAEQTKSGISDLVVETIPAGSTRLWKPLGFTVIFSGASIVGTAIWEYENIRARTYKLINQFQLPRVKRSGWRGTMQKLWQSLDEGQKIFFPICFINLLVFCAWRVPAFQKTMITYFTSSPASRAVCWPMVLSTFSHSSFLHLAANMFVLNSFCSIAVSGLGKEQFLALYLTSGVVSSFVSYFYKAAFKMPGISLGASGAVMGILGFVCSQYPDTRLGIIFLPMFTFSAGAAIKVILGVDALGCAMRWRFLDHAAHIGGALWGIFWYNWGNAYIWRKREPILTCWHEFRDPPKSR